MEIRMASEPQDNKIGRPGTVGEMTVEEAIKLLEKAKTDLTGKEYKRVITVWRDPKNPSLLGLAMVEQA
jgi:hypothetical protein